MTEEKLDELMEQVYKLVSKANDEYIKLIVGMFTVKYGETATVPAMTTALNKVTSLSNTLKRELKKRVEAVITASFQLGAEGAGLDGEYTEEQQKELDQLITDTTNDVLTAIKVMDQEAKRFIRVKTSEVSMYKKAVRDDQGSTAYALSQRLSESKLQKDAKRNFTGLIDKADRRWNFLTYTQMVLRTKVSQAHIYATAMIAKENGIHLFKISTHGATDACRHYEGKIITVGEKIDGYPQFEELSAKGEVFHPNCKHRIEPYLE